MDMDVDWMLDKAKDAVIKYFNDRHDCTDSDVGIGKSDVYIVWFCKTLQNFKALLSTDIPDGMYYEYTYDGDKDKGYLDCYKKWENVVC